MINWELLTARNAFAILVMGIMAYLIFQYFFKTVSKGE